MHCTHSRRLLPRVRGDGTSNSGVDLQRVRSTAMLEASVNVVPSCLRSLLRTSLHRVRGARRGLDHPAAVGYGRHNIIQHAREPREHAVISVVTRRRSTSNRSAWNTWNENMKPSCMLVLDPLPYLTHLPEEYLIRSPLGNFDIKLIFGTGRRCRSLLRLLHGLARYCSTSGIGPLPPGSNQKPKVETSSPLSLSSHQAGPIRSLSLSHCLSNKLSL